MEPRRIELADLRLGFACKVPWDDMVGDDRVRACGACDRQVFNLSEMTRAEAEAVLASRGVPPCVRFYRRPDGTVMTRDCPSGGPGGGRRLAVVASSLAAGATLAVAPAAFAERPAEPAPAEASEPPAAGSGSGQPTDAPLLITKEFLQGIPVPGRTFSEEIGVIIVPAEERPAVEWSVWGRVGAGVASQQRPNSLARRVTVPSDVPGSTSESAVTAELTLPLARHGDLRAGAWGELRTSSDPVAGAELVLEGLPPHPYTSRISGAGSLVLRAGGNARVVTGALGFGYVGSFPRYDPWVGWARHVVGARVVVSMNRTIDDPRDWSAMVGLEVEPIGAVEALFDLFTRY